MRMLDLYSGTHSVGRVAQELGYNVTSLDLQGADIECNVLEWNYTDYKPGYFDIIWASPPAVKPLAQSDAPTSVGTVTLTNRSKKTC